MKLHTKQFILFILLALVIIAIDQATKIFMDGYMPGRGNIAVLPFLDWTLAYNRGAAFSFLGDASGWQKYFFSVIAIGVSLYLIYWLWHHHHTNRLLAWAFMFILAGAVGNLIDRLLYGHVIDFILLHYQHSWFFPAFNVADMSITLGAILVILDGFGFGNKAKQTA